MEKHILINIGRQFGSGGKSVANALGERLGIEVFDSELIAKAAEQSGLSEEFFSQSDEKKRTFKLGGIFGSNRYGGFTNNVLSDSELFKIQSGVIRDIAEKQSAIFLGRASDYVLRDMECLDVFICAPMDVRKETIVQRLSITLEEAESLIIRKDKGRENWYNLFTFAHWGVASNYDLCIDSSILGIEGTADFIIDFGRKAGKI